MDLHLSNDAAIILVLGGFAITCIYWAGKLFHATLTR